MRPPPFVLTAALLFWGWRTDLLGWAALMAAVLEIANFVTARWEFTETEFKRVWDLCMIMVVGEVVILISAQDRVWGQVSFKFFQWLPVPLFPMMLAQCYGNLEKIPLSVFSILLRHLPKSMLVNKAINISWIYYVLCLIGASATARENRWFYPALVLLIFLGLFQLRPRRTSVATWIVLASLVAAGGFVAEQGIFVAQNTLEANFIRWIAAYFVKPFNMRESQTAIGQLGRIRLSGKIIWRLTPSPTNLPPMLLREAAFNVYNAGVWRSMSNELSSAQVDVNDTVALLPPKKNQYSARIAGYLDGGRGLLALPHGTFEIHDLPAITLNTNRMGVARIEDAPEFLNYQVFWGPGASLDGPPETIDLDVPENERATLQEIIDELHISDKSDREKMQTITEFFRTKFTYSMNITPAHRDPTGQRTALGQFLTKTRSGHCEYFATATVLLLRQAGIRARYAIGYGVQERSGNTYIIRERHGHAWTLVYRRESGNWEELDTTPASWSEEESKRATAWEQISDFFSKVKYEFSKWRYSKTSYVSYLQWLLIPLTIVLAWRIFFRKRRRHNRLGKSGENGPGWPGLDSEFYLIEQSLGEAGMGRLSNELPGNWLQRVNPPEPEQLQQILALHRRLRFDPLSLSRDERLKLSNETRQWLTHFEMLRSNKSDKQ